MKKTALLIATMPLWSVSWTQVGKTAKQGAKATAGEGAASRGRSKSLVNNCVWV
jgi:hypothetical protein